MLTNVIEKILILWCDSFTSGCALHVVATLLETDSLNKSDELVVSYDIRYFTQRNMNDVIMVVLRFEKKCPPLYIFDCHCLGVLCTSHVFTAVFDWVAQCPFVCVYHTSLLSWAAYVTYAQVLVFIILSVWFSFMFLLSGFQKTVPNDNQHWCYSSQVIDWQFTVACVN